MTIRKKKLFVFLSLFLFILHLVSFFISYFCVVWSAPLGDYVSVYISWPTHVFLASPYMVPVHAIFPQLFTTSKLVGMVPYPAAYGIAVIFYTLIFAASCFLFRCFDIKARLAN